MPDARSTATEAFSRQAEVFDTIDRANPIIARMRRIARAAAMRHMRPGDHLLELNAGTGLDSIHFAEQGIRVLATDAAPGMLAELERKRALHATLPLAVRPCSFLDLDLLGDLRFDHVFSNFGGLNCTPHLDRVMQGVDRVLAPGGTCTLVIMPRFSPWETGALLKGNTVMALRRWRKRATPAHLEGVTFPCHYHSARSVRDHLGRDHEVIEQRALSLLVPPPHLERIAVQRPRLVELLHRSEEAIANRWPFRNWGDHFLITLRKRA